MFREKTNKIMSSCLFSLQIQLLLTSLSRKHYIFYIDRNYYTFVIRLFKLINLTSNKAISDEKNNKNIVRLFRFLRFDPKVPPLPRPAPKKDPTKQNNKNMKNKQTNKQLLEKDRREMSEVSVYQVSQMRYNDLTD